MPSLSSSLLPPMPALPPSSLMISLSPSVASSSSSSSTSSSSPKKKCKERPQLAFRTVDLDTILDKEGDVEKCQRTDMRAKKQLDQMPPQSKKIKEGAMVHTIEPYTVELMGPEVTGHIELLEKMRCGQDLQVNLKEKGEEWRKEEEEEEEEEEGQCRVCHLVFDVELGTSETIDIGCHCKHDLGIAHRNCAEAWFKIKGNRICEICGATAENIVGNEDSNFMEQWNDADADAENRAESQTRCWQSLSLCNFFLACMVVTFILLWLFKVTIS